MLMTAGRTCDARGGCGGGGGGSEVRVRLVGERLWGLYDWSCACLLERLRGLCVLLRVCLMGGRRGLYERLRGLSERSRRLGLCVWSRVCLMGERLRERVRVCSGCERLCAGSW